MPYSLHADTSDFLALMDKLGENKDNLHTYTMKVGLVAAKYLASSKAARIQKEADEDWNSMKDKVNILHRKGRKHCN